MSKKWALPLACLVLVLASCTALPQSEEPHSVDIVPVNPYNTPVTQTTLYSDEDIFVTTAEPVSPYVSARYDWPLLKEETIFTRASVVLEGTVISKEEICVRPLDEPDSPGQYKTYMTLIVTKIYAQKMNRVSVGDVIRILSPVYSRVWDEYAVDPQINTDYIMILSYLSQQDDKGDKPNAYADYQITNPVENIMESYQGGYIVNKAFTTLADAGVRMDQFLNLTGMEPYYFYENNYPLSPSTHPSPTSYYSKCLTIYYVEKDTLQDLLTRIAN